MPVFSYLKGETMPEHGTRNTSRVSYAGIGLIFGTAIGAGLSLILIGTLIWGAIGTAVGLILGAVTDLYMRNRDRSSGPGSETMREHR
jgi:hypothetical protein